MSQISGGCVLPCSLPLRPISSQCIHGETGISVLFILPCPKRSSYQKTVLRSHGFLLHKVDFRFQVYGKTENRNEVARTEKKVYFHLFGKTGEVNASEMFLYVIIMRQEAVH